MRQILFGSIMAAASTENIEEPVRRTLIRFMNAVRQENTEQAVQLLRPHSADHRGFIVLITSLLIPSSEKTIRSVIQSECLNNKSETDEDIKEPALLVLTTESFRFVSNTVIESSPLLLAIKQGSVDEVRSLLQQLPRDEAVKLMIDGPDLQSAVLSIVKDAEYEEKIDTVIRDNYTLTEGQLTYISARLSTKTIHSSISYLSGSRELISCLVLAAARGSPELMTLLLEFLPKSNIEEIITMVSIIASQSSNLAVVTMTQILLERLPADIKQETCIDWLIHCVCGGVCGVEVISLILNYITWDDEVKNVIIGLLINTWKFGNKKAIFVALLGKVPDNQLGTFLTTNFDIKNFPNYTKCLFHTANWSLLSAAISNGAEKYIESCLSRAQQSAIAKYIKTSPHTVTSELLALINPYLKDFCIPNHPKAKLQMYGVVCFNEFEGNSDFLTRAGASTEAEIITQSFSDVGVKMSPPIKNWTTYSLFSNLRKFCGEIRNGCSLAVVCIMTHGKAGLLYACEGSVESQTDCCKINDILYILGQELPHHIPKVVIVQACQGLRETRIPEKQVTGASSSKPSEPEVEDASGRDSLRRESTGAAGLDAKQAESGRDDTENVHVEIKIPNTILLMSTLYGQDSYRNHFIPALAEEIRKADGERTLEYMFTDASRSMTGHSDVNRQHQNPEYRTSNRKHLIIPRKLTDEEVKRYDWIEAAKEWELEKARMQIQVNKSVASILERGPCSIM